METIENLKYKVDRFKKVLQNTNEYRKAWHDHLRDTIQTTLAEVATEVELDVDFEIRDQIHNLEALVIGLGRSKSGIAEKLEHDLVRPFIRHGGYLVYQQLFNGKILVMINHPFIEGYGEPRPPKNIAIYRPEEISKGTLVKHLDFFLTEVTEWEDYDDDDVETKRIGFNVHMPQEE